MTFPDTLKNLLGIELPIIQAPMAGAATAELAAAVAIAGGLG
jgi:nitronate monooxygenase